jgi:hypothetical protein
VLSEERRFRVEVDRSWEAVQAIAWHYRRLGYAVAIPEPRLRPSFDERAGYGDDFDIAVGERWRFEVKWRGIDFTSKADFPYPTAFVDRAAKAAKTVHLLAGYLTVNKQLTHAALIPAHTRSRWIDRIVTDSVKGYRLHVLECPLDLATIKPIV